MEKDNYSSPNSNYLTPESRQAAEEYAEARKKKVKKIAAFAGATTLALAGALEYASNSEDSSEQEASTEPAITVEGTPVDYGDNSVFIIPGSSVEEEVAATPEEDDDIQPGIIEPQSTPPQ